MTSASSILSLANPSAGEPSGVKLHRFTVDEYHRMAEAGVFHEDDPIELLSGYLFIKLDNGPPYEVPLGIPPEVIAGPQVPPYPQRKFTVREYHRLINGNVLHPTLRTELVEGWVVDKVTRNSNHDSSLTRVNIILTRLLPAGWVLRQQAAITLDDAELEPDFAIARGNMGSYDHRHPRPIDAPLVIEVSESTLSYDRGLKLRDYARNGVETYWIVNLVSRQLDVYTLPSGPTDSPGYGAHQVFRLGDGVPIVLRETRIADCVIDDFFPQT